MKRKNILVGQIWTKNVKIVYSNVGDFNFSERQLYYKNFFIKDIFITKKLHNLFALKKFENFEKILKIDKIVKT